MSAGQCIDILIQEITAQPSFTGYHNNVMDEQLTEQPSSTRRLTDTALVIIAIAAIASWVWRRLRQPAGVDGKAELSEAQALDDKVGGAVGFPPNNAPV